MGQVSWRADDELVERVRLAAKRTGRSMNDYITQVLRAATDPGTEADEVRRVRERLANAGLLAKPVTPVERPSPERVAAALRAFSEGPPLSSFLHDEDEW